MIRDGLSEKKKLNYQCGSTNTNNLTVWSSCVRCKQIDPGNLCPVLTDRRECTGTARTQTQTHDFQLSMCLRLRVCRQASAKAQLSQWAAGDANRQVLVAGKAVSPQPVLCTLYPHTWMTLTLNTNEPFWISFVRWRLKGDCGRLLQSSSITQGRAVSREAAAGEKCWKTAGWAEHSWKRRDSTEERPGGFPKQYLNLCDG